MTSIKPPPQLPVGTVSSLRGITENFAFHASPESFITSRVLQLQAENPDRFDTRAVVRAKILNRNVAVVSSHSQISHVLSTGLEESEQPAYVANLAYADLMAPFFPAPNLLLADGADHIAMREPWEKHMRRVTADIDTLVSDITKAHFEPLTDHGHLNIYESLKTLSWKLLLGTFLGLGPSDPEFAILQALQEELLRGQFSLLPVTISTPFWQSPRKKGKDAAAKLKSSISQRLGDCAASTCPFTKSTPGDIPPDQTAHHALLFTTSLAAKALASLLTAFLLNIFLFRNEDNVPLRDLVLSLLPQAQQQLLQSIELETERLSPPIVGIMRRAAKDDIIPSPGGQPDVLVPKGWDVWLYFVGAGRDPSEFGETWDCFEPERFVKNDDRDIPLAFGGGPKTCLGQNLIRRMAVVVARTCLQQGISFEGEVQATGVRGWLGWERHGDVRPEDWAADMKQLPTQHPTNPIFVRFRRQ